MQKMAYFYLLKDELLLKYQEEYPSWQQSIHDFKTREIANFQRMLENKVGNRISEKWFYTHIKPIQNKKLPRRDTLDILSEFIGYPNWEMFVYQQDQKTTNDSTSLVADPIEKEIVLKKEKKIQSKKNWLIFAGAFFSLILLANVFMQKKNKHMVCFVDADDGTAIQGAIEISIFKNQESPLFQQTDDQGCFSFEESEQPVRFVVDASYYKNDTIVRVFDKNQKKEIIKLHKDDFALMIHLVSTNNLKDWKKRRKQLDQMIDQDAVIFQVNKNHLGLEMYNKTEFINKLTMPINSLKNIKIVDTKYRKGKIFEMRFIQE